MATHRFDANGDTDLDLFYGDLAEHDLQPLWAQQGLLPLKPNRLRPHMWQGSALKTLAEQAGQVVGIDRGGDRRVLALSHPDLDGLPFATPTLWAGVQYLNAGEQAPAHRHSPSALRFVMEGTGVFTLVNGDPIAMNPGDVVLTPSFNWHAHDNPGTEPMMWFDGLDLPLIQSLDAVFFEEGPDSLGLYEQSSRSEAERFYSRSGLAPIGPTIAPDEYPASGLHSPLNVYRWADIDAQLDGMLAGDAATAAVRCVDPTNGQDVMPTMRAEVHRLTGGHRTPSIRMVGSTVMLVHHGSGVSVVDGRVFEWSAGDVLVVPSWAQVDHRSHGTADLFTVSDVPVIEALGLGRTEVATEHQQVQG